MIQRRPGASAVVAAQWLAFALSVLPAAALAAGGVPEPDPAFDARTARMAEQVEARPENAALAAAVARRAEALPADAGQAVRDAMRRRGIEPVRVGGLLHRSRPQTGADLAALDAWLGGGTPLVPTDELGSVEQNAERLAGWLAGRSRRAPPLLVFSVSKGSAEVWTALAGHPELAERVPLWIDLVGALEGTPLLHPAHPARARTRSWLPEPSARSLEPSVRRRARAPLPAGVRAVHVAAFPKVADLSPEAREPFQALRPLGPNDGYLLLETWLRAPGRVLVVRGTDHYLGHRPDWRQLGALVSVLLDEVAAAR